MNDDKKALSVFGVGPIYVISSLTLTVIGLILNHCKILSVKVNPTLKMLMIVVGIVFFIIGVAMWIYAVIFQRISDEIKDGRLITTGVYSMVRNPIYSAFTFVFTGVLVMTGNLYLLILPPLFWIYLTVLLKFTEERWLEERFGHEYLNYCKRVNRVIPSLPKK